MAPGAQVRRDRKQRVRVSANGTGLKGPDGSEEKAAAEQTLFLQDRLGSFHHNKLIHLSSVASCQGSWGRVQRPQSLTGSWCEPADGACYLLIGPLPEDGQGEDGGNRRGEVTGHRLDVDVELAAVGRLEDGDPHNAHHHQDDRHDPGSTAALREGCC